MAKSMELMLYLVVIGLGIIVLFGFRQAYRIINPDWRNSDCYAHFNIIREIKNNDYHIPDEPSRTFEPGRFSYPYLIHLLLSFFPRRIYERVDEYFSVSMDMILFSQILAVYYFGMINRVGVVLGLVLLIATPQFMRPDHPHGVGLSARKPGVIFFNGSVLSYLLWLQQGVSVFAGVAVSFGVLLALTSRFSIQAFAFTLLSFGLFVDGSAFLLLLSTIVLAVVLSKGYYGKVLSDHLRFSYHYATEKQYKFLYDGYKSVDTLKRFRSLRSKEDAKELLFTSILFRSLLDNPFLFLFFVPFVYRPGMAPDLRYVAYFETWVFTGLVVFLLTSFYHLRFLGHAGRYLEHIFLPGVVLISCYSGTGAILKVHLTLVIGVGVATILGYLYFHSHHHEPGIEERFDRVIEYLLGKPAGRVLIQPRFRGSKIPWKTNHEVNDFIGNGWDSSATIAERECLYPDKEGWVTSDTEWLKEKYDPDWVVFNTIDDPYEEVPYLSPPDDEPSFGNDCFEVYRFEAVQETPGPQ